MVTSSAYLQCNEYKHLVSSYCCQVVVNPITYKDKYRFIYISFFSQMH